MRKFRCRKGFTLIEMSIVLVILGIILTTVIKGGEILRSARIKSLLMTQNDLHQAVLAYREKYGYLPGDDNMAVGHVGATASTAPNGNSVIEDAEKYWALHHLMKAGLITGNYDGTANMPMKHDFGGEISIVNYPFFFNAGTVSIPAIKYTKLPYDAVLAMEIALDGPGGTAASGSVQGSTIDDCVTIGGVTTCADNDYTKTNASYSVLSSKTYTVYCAIYPVAP